MRTGFSLAQLADPHLAAAEKNLRACVHCGICTATCPTYVLAGDERDGPRGRIVMMQKMLESGGAPGEETVRHVDRCLSCLGCRTACPSGVDYARLVDAARAHIHAHYERPLRERWLREFIAFAMPQPRFLEFAVALARLFAPIATRLPYGLGALAVKAVHAPRTVGSFAVAPAPTARRVALMPGCVQQALAPSIDQAASRVLARRGIAVKPLDAAGCCGALAFHLGRNGEAKDWARRAIVALEDAGDVEAVTITATGCAAHLAEYGHLFEDEPDWHRRAQAFAARVRDFSELVEPKDAQAPARLRIAYHSPCSLQHGLRRAGLGEAALARAGYDVVAIPEGHLCCGSAGSYSLLQPEIAGALRARKLANIATIAPDAVASANIGCLLHLAGPDAPPVVHPAELIDWAEGGLRPSALKTAVVSDETR